MIFNKVLLSVAALAFPVYTNADAVKVADVSTVHADGEIIERASGAIYLTDLGYTVGCGARNPCCIPSCQIRISNVLGCANGKVLKAGFCKTWKGGDWGIEGCSGYQLHWQTWGQTAEGSGTSHMIVKHGSKTMSFDIHSCSTPRNIGSCVYNGGGCKATAW
ncbi:hypothetical protein NW767_015385 [Fusarium falciforme]|uniref:Secreted protein n=1 Tax=Fusarium falciforme TaxID=195108 RepID=A0A9W8UUF8_9HYPO|nr:hypothetical protein NW755_014767 [Fusarium falciforme]KAJ4176624.1 hypothetical protein NW767_015385 [Fusarium falciforme]KAJ4215321.1 hypothetical protein NW757_014694 [Fusarium falciforme]